MNRRTFLKGMAATAAGILVPGHVAAEPERRVWALDRTMVSPKPLNLSEVWTTGWIDTSMLPCNKFIEVDPKWNTLLFEHDNGGFAFTDRFTFCEGMSITITGALHQDGGKTQPYPMQGIVRGFDKERGIVYLSDPPDLVNI